LYPFCNRGHGIHEQGEEADVAARQPVTPVHSSPVLRFCHGVEAVDQASQAGISGKVPGGGYIRLANNLGMVKMTIKI
jgi:hypothetical protein